MDAEVILGLAAPIILLLCFVGTAGYNKIMVKWRGIIGGVGTAWLVTMGIVLSVATVASIIRAIAGAGSINFLSFVMYIAIAAWGIYALVKAEKNVLQLDKKYYCHLFALVWQWVLDGEYCLRYL